MDLQVYQRAPNTGIFYMTCIWLKSLKREQDVPSLRSGISAKASNHHLHHFD
jgi:hypothetical protein